MEFIMMGHPAVVDKMVDQYRRVYQALRLFNPSRCRPDFSERLSHEGKVLVLSPDVPRESYWNEYATLWYTRDGFECSPHAVGRSIRCICLGDGEMTRWSRADFVRVPKDEFLPDWAVEELAELKDIDQTQSGHSVICGMTTK